MTDIELLDKFAGIALPLAHKRWESYYFSNENKEDRKENYEPNDYFMPDENLLSCIAESAYEMAAHMLIAKKEYYHFVAKTDLLTSSIDVLNLTLHSESCLKNEKIYFICDLIKHTKRELLKIPLLGRKSFKEIEIALNQINLELKG